MQAIDSSAVSIVTHDAAPVICDAQGNVDTKTLLGHTTQKMADLYGHPRGVEPVRVQVNAK